MTIDWTAALVLLTGLIAIGGAYAFVTRLMIRAELAKLYKTFLPREEAKKRDADIERRLEAVGL